MPLNPADLEFDLLAFLRHRYDETNKPALSACVAARQDDNLRPFGQWLEAIDSVALSAADRRQLIDDIASTLTSMSGVNAPDTNNRGNLVCY